MNRVTEVWIKNLGQAFLKAVSYTHLPWSQALIAVKPICDVLSDNSKSYFREDLDRISREGRTAAHEIIAAKKATYDGIGMAIVRVARAVLENENSVLTVSVRLRGEYGGKKRCV